MERKELRGKVKKILLPCPPSFPLYLEILTFILAFLWSLVNKPLHSFFSLKQIHNLVIVFNILFLLYFKYSFS
ncbi:hypothetical protein IC582_022199 [Cucumis melo]